MITLHLKNPDRIIGDALATTFDNLDKGETLWIDLKQPTHEEQGAVEHFTDISLLTREQAEEIESTSRYSETEKEIISNANYFVKKDDSFLVEPVSFILTRDGVLLSSHNVDLDSFADAEKRIQLNPRNGVSGFHVFITLLEARIDHDADMVEFVARRISELNKEITGKDSIDKTIIRRISALQESVMQLRENIYDLQRILSGILRSERFPKDIYPRLDLMIKDVNSLIEHSDFSFERLDYMQDTAMGLINIEQNEIVKILSVAAVIFMPPTLVASIYGMNFKYMPELDWAFTLSNGWVVPAGYFFAIFLMLLFTGMTFWYFRYKKWL